MNINSNYTIRLGNRNIVKIMKGGTVIWEKSTTPVVTPDYFYIKNTAAGTAQTISYKFTGTPSSDTIQQIEYSTDKQNWTTVTLVGDGSSHNLCSLGVGTTVYLRNSSGKCNTANNYLSFSLSSNHEIGGDISTLLDYTNSNVSLPQYGLKSLFMGDTGLQDASNLVLPWMTLTNNCYQNLFRNCSNLTLVPSLPATTLANNCYQSMFQSCTSLVNPPVLPATTLVQECYYGMFLSCSLLNNITVYANDNSATNCTYRWLESVAATGTFYNNGSASYVKNSASGIPQGWTEVKPSQVDYFYVQNTSSGAIDIVLTKAETSANTKTLEYSKDLSNWTSFTPTDSRFAVSLNQNEKLYLRGSNGTRPNLTIWGQANHITGGNVNTLLDYTNPNGVSLPQNAFKSLFNGDLYLTDASNLVLPATTLANNCYSYMFYMCTALTATPTLPATTLAQNCYYNMFAECTSLTTAPVLPATTLAEGCYYFMFYHCTSLTTAPTLPAPTLVSQCYQQMFSKCTSLNSVTTYAEDISATDCLLEWLFNVASSGTLYNLGRAPYPTNSRSGIPDGWTEDKPLDFFYIKNVDSQSGNVSFVFNGSTSYNTLKKIEYSKDRLNWTSVNVSSTETTIPTNVGEKVYFRNNNGYCNNQYSYIHFNSDINVNVGGNLYTLLNYNNVNVSIQSDYVFNYLFVSMTKLLDASRLVLPWTTLRKRCYNSMFGGCSSLITPPELPATTLVQYCYSGMFENCSSLTSITTYAEDISADGCLFGWVGNVNTVGTFYNNGSATYTTGSDGIPSRWTEVKPSTGPDYFYLENADENPGNVSFKFNGTPSSDTIQQIEWSKDKTNWTQEMLGGDITIFVPIDVGEKVYFRNDNGKCSKSGSVYLSFNSDIDTYTGGELYTLLDYTNEDVSLPNYAFSGLFYQMTRLVAAGDLVLRWTTLTQYCYQRMFYGCQRLFISPSLIATTLARYCYREMFQGCTSLNNVTTYTNDISATNCLNNWLYKVAPTGTFYNLGDALYPVGASGIPQGWIEETEPPY